MGSGAFNIRSFRSSYKRTLFACSSPPLHRADTEAQEGQGHAASEQWNWIWTQVAWPRSPVA